MKPNSNPLTWKQCALQALLLAALLVPAFPRVFFNGDLISSADILFKLPPWSHYAPPGFDRPQNRLMFDPLMAFRPDYLLTKQELQKGEWPLWNPLEYSGVPLLANSQSTVFYPPRLLLNLCDVDTAMTIFVMLKLWLCGMTAFICARSLRLGVHASRFYSIAWMIGSYNLIWANWPLPDVSVWVPIVFLGTELLLEGRLRRGFFMTALGGTLILFAGHPETALTMVMGIGFYFLFRLIWERRTGRRLWVPIGLMGAGWAIALVVYSVQLMPFIEFLAHSYTYNERADKQLDIDMPAGAAVAFWVPRFFGTDAEYTFWDKGKWNSNIMSKQYLGMVVWCGLVLLLAHLPVELRDPKRRRQAQCITLAALVGVSLAYYFPIISYVHKLPLFSSMHQIYHICFALFSLPLLGAMGLERWFSTPRRLREIWPLFLLAGLVAALVWYLYSWNFGLIRLSHETTYVTFQIKIAVLFAGVAISIMAASTLFRAPRLWWGVITVFLVVDHLTACRGLNPTLARHLVFPDTELTRYFQQQPKPCRFGVAEASIVSGSMGNYGIEEWLGYDGLFPERIIRYQTELGPKVWDVMEPVNSIQYYLNDPKYEAEFPLDKLLAAGRIERVGTFDGLDLYHNKAAYPRAFLVGNVEVIANRDALFDRMKDKSYKPAETVVTMSPPPGALPNRPDGSPGKATIMAYHDDDVAIETDATRDAVLVLSDAYYPGWKATIDGKPAPIFPAYYAFRGVVIPAGKHTVEFTYFPFSLKLGLAISLIGLLVGLAVCVIPARRFASAPAE